MRDNQVPEEDLYEMGPIAKKIQAFSRAIGDLVGRVIEFVLRIAIVALVLAGPIAWIAAACLLIWQCYNWLETAIWPTITGREIWMYAFGRVPDLYGGYQIVIDWVLSLSQFWFLILIGSMSFLLGTIAAALRKID